MRNVNAVVFVFVNHQHYIGVIGQDGRGNVLFKQQRFAEAAEQFVLVIERQPRNAGAKLALAKTLLGSGDAAKAIEMLHATLTLDPHRKEALRVLIRELVKNRDAKLRNGKQAVVNAEFLVNDLGDASAESLGLLAAAYAETKQFEKAIHNATDAIAKAEASGQHALMIELRKQLLLYQKGMAIKGSR